MKKNIVHATHIDTGGHGYLSVSKKDIVRLDIPVTEFTGCSGHTITRMYLEEDCDASKFMEYAKKAGIEVKVKSGYNLKFNITHNYNPDLFDFNPEAGDEIEFHNGIKAQVIVGIGQEGQTAKEGIRVLVKEGMQKGRQYRIPASNPYSYIKSGKKLKTLLEEINKDIKTMNAT